MGASGPSILLTASMAAVAAIAAGPAQAQADKVVVSIQASQLKDAIAEFAAQTRQQVLYPPDLLAGKRVKPLNGAYAPDRALAILLTGSGVTFQRTPAGVFVLLAIPPKQAAAPVIRAERPSTSPLQPAIPEIVVTGTRLGASGFDSPTPVTSLDASLLLNRSPGKVADAINQLPQMRGSTLANAVRSQSADEGTNGQTLLSMRGLGAARTLILLDGNRLPKTNNAGSTDLNVLPQALIKRVDVVTGGASASYGSEAVAGVINVILDTRFEGFKAHLNSGVTTYGDNASGQVSLAYGRSLGGGRARLVTSLEYASEARIGFSNRPNGRAWFDDAEGVYANPQTGGTPRLVVVPRIRQPNASTGGLITSGPLAGLQFGPGGTLIPFDGGTTPNGQNTSGGDGGRVGAQLTPDSHRMGLFAHAEYDVDEDLTAYLEGTYNRSYSKSVAFPEYQYLSSGQFTIFRSNAYLPAAVVAMFNANPSLESFTVGRFSEDMPPVTAINSTKLGRVAAGVSKRLGDRWAFDASAVYSQVQQNLDRISSINRNLYAAADAVVNPATGLIVCRSNLGGLDSGCVPMNIFGPGAVSASAGAYVTGRNEGHSTFKQTALNINTRGDLGDQVGFGAGPIAIALGLTYRNESVNREVDPLSATYVNCTGVRGCPVAMNSGMLYGGYLSYNPSPLKGRVSATEGYAELGVPLLRDARFAKQFGVTLAGRATDYNLSGLTYSWKVGANWQLNDEVRLRYSRSRDIRAPNMLELFGGGSTSGTQSTLPGSIAVYSGPTYLVANRVLSGIGNPALKPEQGLTETYGVILSPSRMADLRISLDYYKITIADAIVTPGSVAIVDGCYAGNKIYCGFITLNNGTTPVTSTLDIPPDAIGLTIRGSSTNVAVLSTSGLDFDASYVTGPFNMRVMGNYLLTADNSGRPTANTKLVGSMEQGAPWPRWSGSASLETVGTRYSLFLQERLISEGYRNPNFDEGEDITSNHVPLVGYTDALVTYRFGAPRDGRASIYFSVKNVFNRAPPNTSTGTATSAQITNYTLYDVLGRRFTLGLRAIW